MADYVELGPDHDDEFRALLQEAFAPQRGPYDPDSEDRPILGERRGLVDPAGELLVVCAHQHFEGGIRGRDRPIAGMSLVACPPEHRRQGYARELMAESLIEHRDQGQYLSILWPFSRPFYRRLGWGNASRRAELSGPVEQFRLGDGDAGGRMRRLGADDWAAIDEVYEAVRQGDDLSCRRPERWWRERLLTGWEDEPFVYGWEHGGDLRGYVIYGVADRDDGRRLGLHDYGAVDVEAERALFEFLADHDSQVDSVHLHCDPSIPLLDRVEAAGELEAEIHPAVMARLVDVADAFRWLAPPEDREVAFTLAVDDDLAPWNDRSFAVVADDEVRVTPDEERGPTVETDVATLSSVFVGYRSVDRARRTGALTGADEAVGALGALCPPRDTYMRNNF